MSAPDTNLEEQKRRHRGPLAGMRGVAIFAGVLLIALITWLSYNGQEPRDASGDVIGGSAPTATSD